MKIQRHQLVTTILIAYALFMTFFFGIELLEQGQNTRFFTTVGAEAVLIALTFFALRRRDRMRNKSN